MHSFIKYQHNLHFFSPAKRNASEEAELGMYGMIERHGVRLEDPGSVRQALKRVSLDVAIFDTFVAEEMFSHFVHAQYPQCLKVLDLQDFHSLRRLRQSVVEEAQGTEYETKFGDFRSVLRAAPDQENSELFSREFASMVRSDLVVTCSDFEQQLLRERYRLPHVELLTFFNEGARADKRLQDLRRRRNFVWIGNQTHAPNADSLRVLVEDIWPRIHRRLPDAELHVFGSNFQREFSNLEQHGLNMRSCGLMDRLARLQNYRVMLAPIRFGAGIKGKISDAWQHGLPVVTTPVGAEGMFRHSANEALYGPIDAKEVYLKERLKPAAAEQLAVGRSVADYYRRYGEAPVAADVTARFEFGGEYGAASIDEFVEDSVRLYADDDKWLRDQQTGFEISAKRLSFERNDLLLQNALTNYQLHLKDHRRNNYLQQLTWSETLRSTEHLSKYINEKNKHKTAKPASD